MHKKLAQKGIALPLLILIATVGVIGYITLTSSASFKNSLFAQLYPKSESFAASNRDTGSGESFSNLAAVLRGDTATFNFSFSGSSKKFRVDTAKTFNMMQNYKQGFGSGSGSPIIVSNPQSKWDKYICGATIYWRVVTGSIKSEVQTSVIDCSLPGPTPTPTPTPIYTTGNKRVFVTSTWYDGNLGGLTGADNKCQTRADAVGLGGTWKAWLSSQTVSAASRLTHSSDSYQLLDGTVIAGSWSDLTDGTILHQIDLTETNTIVTRDPSNDTSHTWTGTAFDGTIYNDVHGPYDLCKNWTSNYYSSTEGYMTVIGTTQGSDLGGSNLINGKWTIWATGFRCGDNFARLFCFEQ